MYGYIADHNLGRTLVTSEGNAYEYREQPGGGGRWALSETGVKIEEYAAKAAEDWNADWTELSEEEIAEELGEDFQPAEPPLLSVTQVAEKAGVLRAYVKAEIVAGRLPAAKIGNQYVIKEADFQAWMSNPRRGSRSK